MNAGKTNDGLNWYAYRLRGFSPGCQPDGWAELDHGYGRLGAIAYRKPLTAKQRDDYELEKLKGADDHDV